MDLISRVGLESDLNKCEIVDYYDKDDDYVGYFVADTIYSCVRNASKVDAVPIPKDATNGDVIKVLFPYVSIKMFPDINTVTFGSSQFDLNWWNAKYKGGE